MHSLLSVWSSGQEGSFGSSMFWAAACLAFFGFLRSGEFTVESASATQAINADDVAVDSRSSPSVISVHLRFAKTDPFGKGVSVFLGKTDAPLCPVAAMLNYLAVRPAVAGPLFIHADGSPLLKSQFVAGVRRALAAANLDPRPSKYSGHSFRIGAATSAAAAGIPDHLIKTLGRWESSAYLTYIVLRVKRSLQLHCPPGLQFKHRLPLLRIPLVPTSEVGIDCQLPKT